MKPSSWRHRWPLPASFLLHVAGALILLARAPVPAPPLPAPGIELSLVMPLPEIQEEKPGKAPAETPKPEMKPEPKPVPPKPLAKPQKPAPPKREKPMPVPAATENPLSTSREQTEMVSQAQSPLAPATPGGETAATPPSAPPAPAAAAGGPPADYIGQVRARIERNKRYPSAARKYGQEGTVLLAFDLDRSGQVTTWKIVRGSGYSALDEEVGEMIGRTTFPPFPESIDGTRLRLQVPIEFSLQRP